MKIGLLVCLSVIILSIGHASAYGDSNVCSGSVISYQGSYYQQDQIYPSGYSESYSVTLTTITFETDGDVYGIWNNNGEEISNHLLTSIVVPDGWLMPHPDDGDQIVLNNTFKFLSTPEDMVDIKGDLQDAARADDEWSFTYSASQWTYSGSGEDELGNDWSYQGVIAYDSDGMLTSIQETYTLTSGDSVALKQYTWTQTGITPGTVCSSGSSGGGSESDSAALGLGGPGSFIYLGLLASIGLIMLYWQKKHN